MGPTVFGPVMPKASGASLVSTLIAKAKGGLLCGLDVTTTTQAGWVMLFDSATVPADGGVAPLKAWRIGTDASFHQGPDGFAPLLFANGIVVVFSSTGPLTKTESATAFISADVK